MSLNFQILSSLFPHHKLKSVSQSNNSLSYKDHLNEWRITSASNIFFIEMFDKVKLVNLYKYDSEYQACLDFLYLCEVITTNNPQIPKILIAREDYQFCEKNGLYSLEIRIMYGTKGERPLNLELNQNEIDAFEKNGMSFIYQLMNTMEKEETLYQKRSSPSWWTSSQEYHNWIELHKPEKPKIIEKIIYQEPQKKGAKFLIFSIIVMITFYILFFISI